jgi:hypothetical protein
MIRSVLLVVCSLFLSSVALCQSPACPEAQTSAARKAQKLITGCPHRKRSFNAFQKIWKTRKLRSVKCERAESFHTEPMKR